MNGFELFSLIYYALEAYYGRDIEDTYVNSAVSDMNLLVFDDIGSADLFVYEEYKGFIRRKEANIGERFGYRQGISENY